MIPKLPLGTKRAIAQAFDIAIAALQGKEINPVPAARPHAVARLRKAQKKLLEEGYIWP